MELTEQAALICARCGKEVRKGDEFDSLSIEIEADMMPKLVCFGCLRAGDNWWPSMAECVCLTERQVKMIREGE